VAVGIAEFANAPRHAAYAAEQGVRVMGNLEVFERGLDACVDEALERFDGDLEYLVALHSQRGHFARLAMARGDAALGDTALGDTALGDMMAATLATAVPSGPPSTSAPVSAPPRQAHAPRCRGQPGQLVVEREPSIVSSE
jgi:hypothetical protein